MRTTTVISIAGRVLAQAIVLGLWWGGMSSQGVNPEGDADFNGSLVFAAIPTVPPATVIGALAGLGVAMGDRGASPCSCASVRRFCSWPTR